jgi:hypothetical protein
MKTQKTIFFVLLAMALLGSVCSDSVYCPSTGNLKLTVGAASLEDYDVAGQYWDEETDNTADLFVKYGSEEDEDEFKFYVYNDTTGESTEIDCDETESYTFHALVNRALILKEGGTGKYYLCVFDPAHIESQDDIPVAELSFPANTESFIPFYYNDVRKLLSVAVTSSSGAGKICNYQFPVAGIDTGELINHSEWSTLFFLFR